MEIFAAIEQLAFVRALKTSFFAYPIVNAIHILSIGALVTSVVLMDLRLLGAFAAVDRQPFARLLRRVAFTALAGAMITGGLMFTVRASEYAIMPMFQAKMVLIVLAVLNFLAFTLLERRVRVGDGIGVPGRTLLVFSMLLWLAVLLAGRFVGFV